MKPRDFLHRLNHQRIISAIAEAEAKTSGEIRVFIDRSTVQDDPLAFAERKFLELGMHKTAERNAILILVAPRTQKFAVVGDEGVHKQCDPEFWQKLVDDMRVHFKEEEFTDALVLAVERAGEMLGRCFPRRHDDQNELPDAPVEH